MDQDQPRLDRAERLGMLTQTSRGTEMGRLLRRFWQPVARSHTVAKMAAKAIRIMGEDLTLYRGQTGRAYLVGGRCAHRLTVLHTGWVEHEEIRCIYHGWKYDGTGQCVERPAEKDAGPPPMKIVGYPVHEYCGLVFAYLGDGPAPEFDLPRKEAFERPGTIALPREEIWPCNWLQQVENSLDALHVSFVHRAGVSGAFGQAVTARIPKLDYCETEAGIRQIATRGANNVRVSDWTFPNNNHIFQPTFENDDVWMDVGVWVVPVDDERSARFNIYSRPSVNQEQDRKFRDYFQTYAEGYSSADLHDQLFERHKYPDDRFMQLTSAQDYVAQVGQGTIADRANEYLGQSDAGIVLLRKILWRELDALRTGKPTKRWRKLDHPAELPKQAGAATVDA